MQTGSYSFLVHYDIDTKQSKIDFYTYQWSIQYATFLLKQPEIFVFSSTPNDFYIWDLSSSQPYVNIATNDSLPEEDQFDNTINTLDGNYLLLAGAKNVSIFETQNWQLVNTLPISQNITGYYTEKIGVRIALSPDGQQLIATGRDAASGNTLLTSWNVPEFTLNKSISLASDPIRFVQSIDTQTAAISDATSVVIFDLEHEQPLFTFINHQSEIQHVYYVNKLGKMLTVEENRIAYSWNPLTGEILDTFENVNLPVQVLPDRGIAIFGSEIYDLAEKKTLALLEGERKDYDYSQVSPDGQRMLIQNQGIGRIEPIGELIDSTRVKDSEFYD